MKLVLEVFSRLSWRKGRAFLCENLLTNDWRGLQPWLYPSQNVIQNMVIHTTVKVAETH